MRGSSLAQVFRSRDLRLAWLIAIVADAIQIVGLPLFVEGVFSPADTLLDIFVATILTRLLGWHGAFLPGLFAELIPGLDLFPKWRPFRARYASLLKCHEALSDLGTSPLVVASPSRNATASWSKHGRHSSICLHSFSVRRTFLSAANRNLP